MFQNLPLPAAQDVRDGSSGVTPCIVMKNDGVLYHQVSSFSPERWTKKVLQERAVAGSVYRLSWRYSSGAVLPHQCHTSQWTSSSRYIVYGELSLHEENWDATVHFTGVSSLVRLSKPTFRPQWQFVQESRHIPFVTGPTRPVLLHSGIIVAHQKSTRCKFSECGTQFCDALRLPLLTHWKSTGSQHPTGKQGVELCRSPRVVVQYGGCPERHPYLTGMFKPACHCAILQLCIATSFTQFQKTSLCTTTLCHFNFAPGTLL